MSHKDPFFEVIGQAPGAPSIIKLHRSAIVKQNCDPTWDAFVLTTYIIGGLDDLFTIKCFDWNADGGHKLIGTCKTSLRDLSLGSVQLALINPDKQGRWLKFFLLLSTLTNFCCNIRIGYTSSGAFSIDEFSPLPAASIPTIAPVYTLHVSGNKLDSKDLLGKSGSYCLPISTSFFNMRRSILCNIKKWR